MRRWALAGVVVVVAALVVVAIGRHERASERSYSLQGIANVRVLIGNRIGEPYDYRVGSGLSCLIYPDHGRFFALELCIDAQGRVVEAVDRRGSVSRFYTVVDEPGVADQRLDPAFVVKRILALQRRA